MKDAKVKNVFHNCLVLEAQNLSGSQQIRPAWLVFRGLLPPGCMPLVFGLLPQQRPDCISVIAFLLQALPVDRFRTKFWEEISDYLLELRDSDNMVERMQQHCSSYY